MATALTALLWLASLAIALYAAEKLVHYLSALGHDLHMSAGVLGLLVALGADAPEVTSALVAAARGSTDIGLGVVMGSNIYNLAGLLGLAAIIARSIHTGPYRITLDGGANVLLTLLLLGLVTQVTARQLSAGLLLTVLALYAVAVSLGRRRVLRLLGRPAAEDESEEKEQQEAEVADLPLWPAVALSLLSAIFIVIGSDLLVNTSISLASAFGVPDEVVGTFVLAIATSLPNTWAAISLARRGLAAAAIATTFNSNSINAAIGAGLPSLFLTLHAANVARTLDAPWLLGMTIVAILLLATRWTLTRLEGSLLVGLYAAFVVVRLVLFG